MSLQGISDWLDPDLSTQISARQTRGLEEDPLVISLWVLGSLVLAQMLQAALPWPGSQEKPRLESDQMCGLVTTGQDECYWDCSVSTNQPGLSGFSIRIISNLTCLLDCFPEDPSAPGFCITSLLRDVIRNKTCDWTGNPGTYGVVTNCQIGAQTVNFNGTEFTIPSIINGTCSPETERLLLTDACRTTILYQPSIIQGTILTLMGYSCNASVLLSFLSTFLPLDYGAVIQSLSELLTPMTSSPNRQTVTTGPQPTPDPIKSGHSFRLAPIIFVNGTSGAKTELNFTNTRHRYPWICSLRTRGASPEHLCAVSLLSVPPQPTVIVGAAHCTYLCKEGGPQGLRLPSCCCTPGQAGCREEVDRCGEQPVAVEMVGRDVDIICGEWETGDTPREFSGEEYNVVMRVTGIARHPNFRPDVGPEEGSDIAIFKVKDSGLTNSRQMKIYPACLPPSGKETPTEGVHAGWSTPPPLNFLRQYATGFVQHVLDFYKMWHYKMDIDKKCEDSKVGSQVPLNLTYPSNTYYPSGLVCAKEFTRSSCFSNGDSGSPLMVRNPDSPMRYYIEGLLSFVKGCDNLNFFQTFSFGRNNWGLVQSNGNPLAYTKLSCFLPWVAQQYGLSHEGDPDNPSCTMANGERKPSQPCRTKEVRQDENGQFTERRCIIPFYSRGRRYDECALLEPSNFVYPVFRCPQYNSVKKTDGINDYGDMEPNSFYCLNSKFELDISIPGAPLNCPTGTLGATLPFSTCKNDCPGVKGSAITAVGTVLFLASAQTGLGLLSAAGPGLLGLGVLGGAGGLARAFCSVPWCRAPSGQCCFLIGARTGPRCPRSC